MPAPVRSTAHSALEGSVFDAVAETVRTNLDPEVHPELHARVEASRRSSPDARRADVQEALEALEADTSGGVVGLHLVLLLLEPAGPGGPGVSLSSAQATTFARAIVRRLQSVEERCKGEELTAHRLPLLSYLVELYRPDHDVRAAREALIADANFLELAAKAIGAARADANPGRAYVTAALATDLAAWLMHEQPLAVHCGVAGHPALLAALGSALVGTATHPVPASRYALELRSAALSLLHACSRAWPMTEELAREEERRQVYERVIEAGVPAAIAHCAMAYREPVLIHAAPADRSAARLLDVGAPLAPELANPLCHLETQALEFSRVKEYMLVATVATALLAGLGVEAWYESSPEQRGPVPPFVHAAHDQLVRRGRVRAFLPIVKRLLSPPAEASAGSKLQCRATGVSLLGALLTAAQRNLRLLDQPWPTADGSSGATDDARGSGWAEAAFGATPVEARGRMLLATEFSTWMLVDCAGEPLVRTLKVCLRDGALRELSVRGCLAVDLALHALIEADRTDGTEAPAGAGAAAPADAGAAAPADPPAPNGTPPRTRCAVVAQELRAAPAWSAGVSPAASRAAAAALAVGLQALEDDAHDAARVAGCAAPGCRGAAGGQPVAGEGGLRLCSRCRAVSYCSRECQARHWKSAHRAECIAISAPAALPAAAAPGAKHAAAPPGEEVLSLA